MTPHTRLHPDAMETDAMQPFRVLRLADISTHRARSMHTVRSISELIERDVYHEQDNYECCAGVRDAQGCAPHVGSFP
jgi:hypothetical protein